jgi:hypothetical protein
VVLPQPARGLLGVRGDRRWYVEDQLTGGPLDGLLLDVTGWTTDEIATGAALPTGLGRFPGGRTLYDRRLLRAAGALP